MTHKWDDIIRREQEAQQKQLRVAAYLRVSTEEQADSGLGMEAQRKNVQDMATRKGWAEVTHYRDEGVSGTKDVAKRPELAKLLAAVRAGEVDVVVVSSLDRLARNTLLVLDLVNEIATRCGVAFVSVKEADIIDSTTPQGLLALTIFAALAQFERDQIAQRTKDAMAARGRRDGERGGRLPYGYLRTAESIAVDPYCGEVVRRIYGMRRRGLSLRAIAAQLEQEGIPSPVGGPWLFTAIRSILAHEKTYQGGRRGASEKTWPQILEPAPTGSRRTRSAVA